MSTVTSERTPCGIPIILPNRVSNESKEFYVSYNDCDQNLHGGHDTTAMVVGQMQAFYILNGNHEKVMGSLSFDECLNYVHDHKDQLGIRSDKLIPRGSTVEECIEAGRLHQFYKKEDIT